MEPLSYDAPAEVAVSYSGNSYVLREADGATALAYKTAQTRGAKMTDGKLSGDLTGIAEAVYVLVGGCLFLNGKAVGTNGAKALPNRMVEDLFERAKNMSGLGERADEAALMKKVFDAQKDLAEFRRAKAAGGQFDPKQNPADSTAGSESAGCSV